MTITKKLDASMTQCAVLFEHINRCTCNLGEIIEKLEKYNNIFFNNKEITDEIRYVMVGINMLPNIIGHLIHTLSIDNDELLDKKDVN